MRECKEEPSTRYKGHYNCGNGITVGGKRYCPDSAIQIQIDYAGHAFCACLGKKISKEDAKRILTEWQKETDDAEARHG